MGPRFIPATIMLAMLAFATAAASMAFVPEEARLWPAAIALIVLGGITPMIYAVNVRVVPVFSRRAWPSPRLLFAALAAGIAGAWLVYLGRALPLPAVEALGSGLALAGGLGFVWSVARLFRAPATGPAVVAPPDPGQAAVDRIGQRFTRMAGIYLLAGLLVRFVTVFWTPAQGRWDLVWAHTLLLGWFLSMAAGVCYHVLPRWTGRPWRRPGLIRLHFHLVRLGLPVMILALALDARLLFMLAGPIQTLALLLFVWNIAPQVRGLPSPSCYGVGAAAGFLVLGASLGAGFALDPAHHVGLRFSHAQLNLFGWAALLVCGVGYYLFPRFAGQPLRWPRLALAQLALLSASVALSAVAWWWYFRSDGEAALLITVGGLLTAGALLAFGGIIGATFRAAVQGAGGGRGRGPRGTRSTVSAIAVGQRRPASRR